MLKFNRPTALALAAAALMIGTVAPWINVLGFISAGPTNFTEVWTVMFLGIAAVIASACTGRFMRLISIVVGTAVLAEVVYVWFHLSEEQTHDFVHPSWGLFFSAVAALFLVASTWIAKQQDA